LLNPANVTTGSASRSPKSNKNQFGIIPETAMILGIAGEIGSRHQHSQLAINAPFRPMTEMFPRNSAQTFWARHCGSACSASTRGARIDLCRQTRSSRQKARDDVAGFLQPESRCSPAAWASGRTATATRVVQG